MRQGLDEFRALVIALLNMSLTCIDIFEIFARVSGFSSPDLNPQYIH